VDRHAETRQRQGDASGADAQLQGTATAGEPRQNATAAGSNMSADDSS
jgi:hypothetical protein